MSTATLSGDPSLVVLHPFHRTTSARFPTKEQSVGQIVDFRYRNYISSDAWKQKRLERLEHDGRECSECGNTKHLQVHHLTYERLGNELLRDLLTLCDTCHSRLHGRVPGVLPLAGSETPNQRTRRSDLQKQQEFLAAAQNLDRALQAFIPHAHRHGGKYDEAASWLQDITAFIVDDAAFDFEHWSRRDAARGKRSAVAA